ncbi:MAG: hypothetical protein BGO43_12480 [Gammaproteobacteria bacterium 39-13]|jgi:hypothetical protein|nr:hypothetical protein [Gammaproteobacteria bacterium]OJV89964.1 MAG: hypothetical protein BGO43_12480 [Gammaproteobacteria bacterium 39-13]
MTYFIVEAPYDKCFDIFFQNELGYPNFYRMTELLSGEEKYDNLTLVAPYPTKEPTILDKITERVNNLGMSCVQFGDDLETAFSFDMEGKMQIHPQFKQALHHAVTEFLDTRPRLRP